MANKKIFLGILLFSTLFNLFNSQEDPESINKNSRVLACVSLARGAMKNERVKIIITIKIKIIKGPNTRISKSIRLKIR